MNRNIQQVVTREGTCFDGDWHIPNMQEQKDSRRSLSKLSEGCLNAKKSKIVLLSLADDGYM